MSTYTFDESKGAGVPGLSHVITDEEAAALGVSDLLMAAIENGSYVETPPLTHPHPSTAASTPPLRTNMEMGKKKKE